MKIAVHGKRFIAESKPVIQKAFDLLQSKDAQVMISNTFMKYLNKSKVTTNGLKEYRAGDNLREVNFMITLGGDGTLLEAITHIGKLEIPILGINTGKLGFLATTSKEGAINAIEAIFKNEYSFDCRTLIRLESNKDIFKGLTFALNDITILKKDTSSMIVVHAYINGEFLNSYWADGLIISTPTGSTGYSLSCGGPIVLSQSNNFIITPVSPHNLTVRPLVVPDENVLSFKIEGRKKKFLISLDSRYETVSEDVELTIKKESFKAKLVVLKDYNFFDTLRQKLNWGLDIRN